MARIFNGISDKGAATIDLSAYSTISVSLWLWWDANSNDDKIAYETGTTYPASSGTVLTPNNSVSSGTIMVAFGLAAGIKTWQDRFPQPSAAAWHHFLIVQDRSIPSNAVWIDGLAQTLTTQQHDAAAYGNFGSSTTLNFMCRNGASLFGAGRMADLVIWGGGALGQNEATYLAAGGDPVNYPPASIVAWWPLAGFASPEPNAYGTAGSVTLTGTTGTSDPVYPSSNRGPGSSSSVRASSGVAW